MVNVGAENSNKKNKREAFRDTWAERSVFHLPSASRDFFDWASSMAMSGSCQSSLSQICSERFTSLIEFVMLASIFLAQIHGHAQNSEKM